MNLNKYLIIILTIFLITGCGCSKKNDKDIVIDSENTGIIENKNEGIVRKQEIDVFSFEKTSLKWDRSDGSSGTSTLITTVTNTSDKDEKLEKFNILIKDEEGSELITLIGLVGGVIKASESKVIVSRCGIDLSKAYTIEYTKVN